MVGDLFIQKEKRSTNIFVLVDIHPTPATNIAKLDHRVQEPARTVNMVPALENQSLLSGVKFSEAGYVSACDGEEVNIYDGRTAKITLPEEALLKGWWCPRTKSWRIPFRSQVVDLNMHILVLNDPTVLESLNSLYNVPSSASVMDHIEIFNNDPARPAAGEVINNVYKLPIMERSFRYLHLYIYIYI